MTSEQTEIAGQIERAYRGYHVWVSDGGEGYWYATRVNARARGISRTVCGADPDELTDELAAEETAGLSARRAVTVKEQAWI